AYLARVSLYQGNYSEAQSYAEDVLTLVDYSLEPDFGNVWSINNPNGVESIFEIQHNYDPVQWTGSALPSLTRSRADGGWGFATPSSHLESFMQGDPRLVHTIIKEGDYVDADHPTYDTQPDQNESGRTNRKFYIGIADRAPDDEHLKAQLNHILFRFADLLLIHAEGAYHNSQEGAATTSLNLVRDRVGLGPLSVSGQDLLNAIYYERRMELALEGHRYYDLKRSGRLDEAMNDFVNYNLNISTDQYDSKNPQGVLYDPLKHFIFPIPQSEIDMSGGVIKQNTEYN
ncbi:MAG: RagB/SusD family nutrient uptake outer membrane protein, partial [Bacteroidia bacterium]